MNTNSEGKLAQVYPKLAELIRQLAIQLSVEIEVVQGLRTWAEQDALYAQGRTTPGSIVTHAKGGQSYHNFGLAVDVCPADPTKPNGFHPDWNAKHPIWGDIVDAGQALGLTSGKSFGDLPHFQLTGRFPLNKPSMEVISLYQQGGLQTVWNALK